MKLSVIIPSYNGRHLLGQHLPAVVATKPEEIIVVDDASTDTSVEFITANFPQIKLVRLSHNVGFARAVNAGVAAAKGDIVILFNNDVSPQSDCLIDLVNRFAADPQLFSIGFWETDPRTGNQRGKSRGYWQRGLVHHAQAPDLDAGSTFWTFAAAAAYRKSMWDKLGGLDTLFRPAYWEDIDLSYRAQKQGWRVAFDPTRRVVHTAESTMKPIFGQKMTRLAYKNQLLFVWKNITSIKLLMTHLLWLPYHIVFDPSGFFLALLQLPEAVRGRYKQLPSITADEVILNPASGR